MTSLTEFLVARYDEAEKAARAVKPLGEVVVMGGERHPESFGHSRHTAASADGYPRTLDDPEARQHFARHEPTAVLADLASKRAILALCDRIMKDEPAEGWYQGASPVGVARLTKLYLATPYGDHADYREEWRP